MKKDNIDEYMINGDIALNIDFGKYRRILKRHWKTLLWWCLAGFSVGCIVALATPRKFVCTSKLAPELSTTATNRLSSVASLVGFTSTVLGTTDAVYPMVYPDLVHSPEFIVDLFDMQVDFLDKKDTVHTTLYDYMENYSGKTAVGNVLFAPMTLLGNIMEKINGDESKDSTEVFDPFSMTRKQGRIYRMLCKCIDADIDKKTLIVTIKTTMDDRFVCGELSREVNEGIKKYVTRYRTEKAIHDRDYYQKMNDESRADYLMAQDRYTRFIDSHQGVILQRVSAEGERLRNDVSLKYQLYSSMAQQLQSAEAKVQLETPVFVEVVAPTTPLRSVNSRKNTALWFAFLFLCIGTFRVIRKWRNEDLPEISNHQN